MPFLVDILQGPVDILQLRCKACEIPRDIGGYFFSAMNAFVLLDVVGHFFGHRIMVAKQGAEKIFHNVGFWLFSWPEKTGKILFNI